VSGSLAPFSPVPPPSDFNDIDPLFVQWVAGREIVRVYDHTFGPTNFNPGRGARIVGRFHFFADAAGSVVPVLYGSARNDGAIAETVFHDVPTRSAVRVVPAGRLKNLSIVSLSPQRDLRLVELRGFGLTRLRLAATNLTDTEAREYPNTVPWAKALHDAFPDADGLLWMSRRFNAAEALVLFGSRVAPGDLAITSPPLPLAIGPGREKVDDAANRADILVS
jgi:hypothetical protein